MKRLLLSMVALAALGVSSLHAQQITGTWQGSLKVGAQELRLVFKIALEDDKLKTVLHSIDQGGQIVPTASTAFSGGSLKIGIPAIGGGYEGKLNPDGNSITGTWSQGGGIPLNLVRATPATEWAIPEPPPPPRQMKADADPDVEVSTVKPTRPGSPFYITINRSGVVTSGNTSLRDLIKFAYDLHPKQISGGESWTENERFDATVKADTPGMPNLRQMKSLMQKFLADRFQLKFHRDQKEQSVYAIAVVKTGPKLSKSDTSPNGLPGFGGGARGLQVRNATIAEFATMLQANILDQPMVDQTGLGNVRWDFLLRWTPDSALPGAAAAAADNPDAPPDIFTAFAEQLGLRLQKAKAMADVIIIDRAEKPSAN